MVLIVKSLRGNVLYHNSPDGGWAWVVLCAGFFINAIVFSVGRGISIFYNDFKDYYDITNSQTSWIYSIAISMVGIAAPIGTKLMRSFDPRKILIISGLLCCLGMISAVFATRVWMVYVGIGLIWGCGFSWTTVVVITQVNLYFSRWRGVANGIVTCGTAFGAALMPLVFQRFSQILGWRGTFFIIAGLELNICVFAALIRPISNVSESKLTKYRELPYGDRETNLDELRKTTISLEVLDYIHKAESPDNIRDRSCIEHIGRFMKDHWLLALYALVQLTAGIILFIPIMYIVPFSKDAGCTDEQAALLLSLASVGDIACRLLSGIMISSFRRFEKNILHVMGTIVFVQAAICTIPILDNQFLTLATYIVLYGSMYGSFISCNTSSFAILLGKENLPKYIGGLFFMSGVSILISPPIAGYLVDISGTYVTVFWYNMVGCIFTSVLIFVVGVCHNRRGSILPERKV